MRTHPRNNCQMPTVAFYEGEAKEISRISQWSTKGATIQLDRLLKPKSHFQCNAHFFGLATRVTLEVVSIRRLDEKNITNIVTKKVIFKKMPNLEGLLEWDKEIEQAVRAPDKTRELIELFQFESEGDFQRQIERESTFFQKTMPGKKYLYNVIPAEESVEEWKQFTQQVRDSIHLIAESDEQIRVVALGDFPKTATPIVSNREVPYLTMSEVNERFYSVLHGIKVHPKTGKKSFEALRQAAVMPLISGKHMIN